ncbi:ImuA family protein [Jannaschia sp. 2305UL9-9]|uniref:ImuA family protein n=1 Tax=Jannaschia sp. 2305UL9-9 TaxID=3121638 RepID=UPI0035296454
MPPTSETRLPAVTEAFGTARDAAATALVLAQLDTLGRSGPILWVQDRLSAQEGGLPYTRGIAGIIGEDKPILRVAARTAAEALWAMEEGLECAALSAVIGEVWGTPRVLDFTASKRLALRSQRSGVPLWLLRPDAEPGLSVAPDRWHVSAALSTPNMLDSRAPGTPRWMADLFRSRRRPPGIWMVAHDRATHRLHLDAPLRDGAVGTGPQPIPAPDTRAVG